MKTTPEIFSRQTKGDSQTKDAGEYQVLLEVLSQTHDLATLHINVTSPYVRDILTSNLPKKEDEGWINVPNSRILQAIVATLRAWNGKTMIGKIRDKEIKSKVRDMAKAGLALDDQNGDLYLEPPEAFLVTGVCLSRATQSTLYKSILEQKVPHKRAASILNLGITKACIEELTNKSPMNHRIWTSEK